MFVYYCCCCWDDDDDDDEEDGEAEAEAEADDDIKQLAISEIDLFQPQWCNTIAAFHCRIRICPLAMAYYSLGYWCPAELMGRKLPRFLTLLDRDADLS